MRRGDSEAKRVAMDINVEDKQGRELKKRQINSIENGIKTAGVS